MPTRFVMAMAWSSVNMRNVYDAIPRSNGRTVFSLFSCLLCVRAVERGSAPAAAATPAILRNLRREENIIGGPFLEGGTGL